jgi:hypothetical protein
MKTKKTNETDAHVKYSTSAEQTNLQVSNNTQGVNDDNQPSTSRQRHRASVNTERAVPETRVNMEEAVPETRVNMEEAVPETRVNMEGADDQEFIFNNMLSSENLSQYISVAKEYVRSFIDKISQQCSENNDERITALIYTKEQTPFISDDFTNVIYYLLGFTSNLHLVPENYPMYLMFASSASGIYRLAANDLVANFIQGMVDIFFSPETQVKVTKYTKQHKFARLFFPSIKEKIQINHTNTILIIPFVLVMAYFIIHYFLMKDLNVTTTLVKFFINIFNNDTDEILASNTTSTMWHNILHPGSPTPDNFRLVMANSQLFKGVIFFFIGIFSFLLTYISHVETTNFILTLFSALKSLFIKNANENTNENSAEIEKKKLGIKEFFNKKGERVKDLVNEINSSIKEEKQDNPTRISSLGENSFLTFFNKIENASSNESNIALLAENEKDLENLFKKLINSLEYCNANFETILYHRTSTDETSTVGTSTNQMSIDDIFKRKFTAEEIKDKLKYNEDIKKISGDLLFYTKSDDQNQETDDNQATTSMHL